MSTTRLYPQIDVSLLNERYTDYKRKPPHYESVLDEDVEDALRDDDGDEDEEDNDFSSGTENEHLKETLFDDYNDDDDDDDEDYHVDDEEPDIEDDEDEFAMSDDEGDDPWLERLKPVVRVLFRVKQHWKKLTMVASLVLLSVFIVPALLSQLSRSGSSQIIPNVKSFGDISKSIQSLQWQINDINTKQKGKLHDLRNYLDLKMDEVAGRFQQVDKRLDQLQRDNEELVKRLDSLNLEGGIDLSSNGKIPILLDEHNNVQLLPEFKEYLHDYIRSTLQDQHVQKEFQLNYEKFVQDYINEIVNEKIGFMKKEEILHLITLQFQENKRKLIQEIKQLTQIRPQPDELPQKLIPKTAYEKRSKIDYAQSSNGARIINYLSSPTFRPKTKSSWLSSWRSSRQEHTESEDHITPSSPFIVLTGNEGFWRSSEINASLGIKFLEPIYINEFKYVHRHVLNSAMLTSCPKAYEVFVHTDDPLDIDTNDWKFKGDTTMGKYHKVMECEYDVNGAEEQACSVPDTVKRILAKSVVVRVRGNYGNDFFTSLYKFRIHGLTRFDLASVERLLGNDEIGEGIKRSFRVAAPARGPADGGVKRFGDDHRIV